MSDGIKQKRVWHRAFHPLVPLEAAVLLVRTLIKDGTRLNAREPLVLLTLTSRFGLYSITALFLFLITLQAPVMASLME